MAENKKTSFDLLREENESKFDSYNQKVKNNLDGRKDIWSFFGELIDLYIPKILSTLLGGASISASETNKIKED